MNYEQILDAIHTARQSMESITNLSDGEIAALYEAHWQMHIAIKAHAFMSQLPQADRMHCAEGAQMMALESFEE